MIELVLVLVSLLLAYLLLLAPSARTPGLGLQLVDVLVGLIVVQIRVHVHGVLHGLPDHLLLLQLHVEFLHHLLDVVDVDTLRVFAHQGVHLAHDFDHGLVAVNVVHRNHYVLHLLLHAAVFFCHFAVGNNFFGLGPNLGLGFSLSNHFFDFLLQAIILSFKFLAAAFLFSDLAADGSAHFAFYLLFAFWRLLVIILFISH